ncbi:uncharacterized protein LOC143202038 isoform X3 [Rhynchophorus ferrugineus]|uniref:uncharacterized protein LOC143202038 isoform X3 n=1 Tax=Rhynchophorus ferrugineus TaxID=354439 RepID=UPI003FCC9F20
MLATNVLKSLDITQKIGFNLIRTYTNVCPTKKDNNQVSPGDQLKNFGSYVAECLPKYVQKICFSHCKELEILIAPEGVVPVMQFLKDHHNSQMECLMEICAIDVPSRNYRFEVIYNLLSLRFNSRVQVKTYTDELTPLDSVTGTNVRLVNRRFRTIAEDLLNLGFKKLESKLYLLIKSTDISLGFTQDDMEIKCISKLLCQLEILNLQYATIMSTIWRYVYNEFYRAPHYCMYGGLIIDTHETFIWKFVHCPDQLYSQAVVRDYEEQYQRETALRPNAPMTIKKPGNNVYTGYGDIETKFFYYGVMNDGAYNQKFHPDEENDDLDEGDINEFVVQNRGDIELVPINSDDDVLYRLQYLGFKVDVTVSCPPQYAPLKYLRSLPSNEKNVLINKLIRKDNTHIHMNFECLGAHYARLPTKYLYIFDSKKIGEEK